MPPCHGGDRGFESPPGRQPQFVQLALLFDARVDRRAKLFLSPANVRSSTQSPPPGPEHWTGLRRFCCGPKPALRLLVWLLQERPNFRDELLPRGLILEREVVMALEGHEPGVRDRRRNRPALIEGHALVALGVQHQRRDRNEGQAIEDVDTAPNCLDASGVLTRRGNAL